MKFSDYTKRDGEKPLDNIVTNGGFCGILHTIACIGDSLAAGNMRQQMKKVKQRTTIYTSIHGDSA